MRLMCVAWLQIIYAICLILSAHFFIFLLVFVTSKSEDMCSVNIFVVVRIAFQSFFLCQFHTYTSSRKMWNL